MKPTRVLFILKERGEPYYGLSSDTGQWKNKGFTGLSNSVRYLLPMLQVLGIDAFAAVVGDNNKIDGAIKKYQATHVIVEALWVVPEKFPVLMAANPGVYFNVRLHSEIPFLAQEGIAMSWLFAYSKAGVSISTNSLRVQAVLSGLLPAQALYMPNYYPLSPLQPFRPLPADGWIDIGCFGAIRPLKNQLSQAIAAVNFATGMDRHMRFHINADRVEGGAMSVLRNLQGLFANEPNYLLVEHGWMDPAAFFALLKTMDLAMQVSFSETFNIVSADATVLNIPIVVSPEVAWASSAVQADPTNIPDIVSKMQVAWFGSRFDMQAQNYQGLVDYDTASEIAWPVALTQMAGMVPSVEVKHWKETKK